MSLSLQKKEVNQSVTARISRKKLQSLSKRQISDYALKEKIGTGSYAKVYRAVHKATEQNVAVKVMSKRQMTSQQIEKVHLEVEIQKQLFHSNIARIYELHQTQDKVYIFMEYCPKGELFNYINKNGPPSEKFACKIFKQILSAMKYMKSQRIFHRDIKCENILFDQHWNAKLVDFGFATKQEDGCMSQTFCGSPSYTAPQIAKRKTYNSELIDVWSLGVTLYAMLAGKLPFDSEQINGTKNNIMQIKYLMRNQFSLEAKELFRLIFKEDQYRANIEEVEESSFCEKYQFREPTNFINVNTEQICVDAGILSLMEKQFNIDIYSVIESVTKFKVDPLCSLYYLTAQREIAKGVSVRGDIASVHFQKSKKRSTTLRLMKISMRSESIRKRMVCDKMVQSKISCPTIQMKGRSSAFRVRPSVDVNAARLRIRDDSPQSPKRILDKVSAYRRMY